MKKKYFIPAICGVLSLLSVTAFAQSKEEDNNTPKAKVDITVIKDGKTTNITVDEAEPHKLSELLEQVEELKDINLDLEAGAIEVIVKKIQEGEHDFPGHFRVFTEDLKLEDGVPGEKRAFLGVVGTGNGENGKGITLMKVIDGSPAEKAGLKEGDVVLEIDGEEITDFLQLAELVRSKKPGEAVAVKTEQNGKSETRMVTLGERAERVMVMRNWDKETMPVDLEKMAENHSFKYQFNKQQGFLGINYSTEEEGVLVESVIAGSPAAEAALAENDRIIEMNGKKVQGNSFAETMSETKPGEEVNMLIVRDGKELKKSVVLGERKNIFGSAHMFNPRAGDVHFFNKGENMIIKIRVEKEGGTEEESEIEAAEVKSAGKFENLHVGLYPNPGDGKFTLDIDLPGVEELEIQVTDNTGKAVYEQKISGFSGKYKNTIDISRYADGIYSLIIKSGEKVHTEKLIKK